jgi:hypothetical protein
MNIAGMQAGHSLFAELLLLVGAMVARENDDLN